MNSPESAIRADFTTLNSSDVDEIVAVFADDGSVMANEFPSATGLEQLQRMFTGIFMAMSFKRELHVDRIIEEGNLATAQTHTTGTLTMLDTNITISGISRELWVLRKTGSQWGVVDYMFNQSERAGS
jgi:ketosteroid isomerase-like protein